MLFRPVFLLVAVALMAASMVILCLAACIRNDGRNPYCQWPGESNARGVNAWHLSQDAEFAEDLAIRYADVHHGLRTPYYEPGNAYKTARDSCIASLFAQIAKQHQVPVQHVYDSLGRNRVYIDLIGIVPFVLVYCFVVTLATRLVWSHYPPVEDGWIPGVAMLLLLSFAFAVGGVMIGEVWSWIIERYRVGNPHMSYRAQRLIWSRHPTVLFISALAIFGLAALDSVSRLRPRRFEGPA